MNLCFLIDNSITMSQQAYNGLSLLQIAKSYIQKALENKSFNKFFNGQPLNYHLFVSSSAVPLSTYQHEELHFGNQLKYIQIDYLTDLAETLQEMFKHLNKYRILYQSQTVFGAVDPYKLKPSLIVIFTDSSDPVTLHTIHQKIQAGQLKCKHDAEVYILRICPPCRDDKTSLEVLRKTVEADESAGVMREISEQWNGKYFQVHRYQYGFEVMDSILNTFTPRIHIKFQIIDKTPSIQNYSQTGISGILSQKQSSLFDKTQFMVSSIHKGRSRRSGLPLPVTVPKLKMSPLTNTLQVDQFDNPLYVIDVSKSLDFAIHQFMPHEKLQLQVCELTCLLQQQCQKLRIQKLLLPVYYQPDDRLIPFGLLKVSEKKPVQLLIYMANYIQFNPIFNITREKKVTDRLHALNSLDIILNDYLIKIPSVYDIYIIDILMIRGFHTNLKRRNEELLKLNEQVEKMQFKERTISQQKFMINAKDHQKYSSSCCPVYSAFYHQWSSGQKQGIIQDKYTKDVRSSIQRILQLKKLLLPDVKDDIYLQTFQLKSMTLEIDNYNIKTGGENQPLGNPYRRRKKSQLMNPNVQLDISSDPSPSNNILILGGIQDIQKIQQKQISEFLHTHQQSKSEFQQLQKQQQFIKLSDNIHPEPKRMQVQHPIDKQSQSSQSSRQSPSESNEQLMVRKLMGIRLKNEKVIELRFNSSNIKMASYQKNKLILNQNNIQ